MTVDEYTLEIPVAQCVEISRNGKIEFSGSIRELQEHFYTLCQRKIVAIPYKIANTHYIQIQ